MTGRLSAKEIRSTVTAVLYGALYGEWEDEKENLTGMHLGSWAALSIRGGSTHALWLESTSSPQFTPTPTTVRIR